MNSHSCFIDTSAIDSIDGVYAGIFSFEHGVCDCS